MSNEQDAIPADPKELEAAITERVIRIVAEAQDMDPSAVSISSTLHDLGFDSLELVELMFSIEEEFDLIIPDDVARNVKSVQDIVERLKAHLSQPEAE